jgi:hypothetical protein
MESNFGRIIATGLLGLVAAWCAVVLMGPVLVGAVHREAWNGASIGVTAIVLVVGLGAVGIVIRLVQVIRQHLSGR